MVHETFKSEEKISARALDRCISDVARNDQAALEELYMAMRTPVYAFALSMLKSPQDAEDVLHDCLISIAGAAGSYKSTGKPMAWIITIAKNRCLQLLRERGRCEELNETVHEAALSGSERMSEADRLILSFCLNELSDAERQIVTLHATAGFKHREIAALLSLPLSTVLSKYNRAMKKMRRYLADEVKDHV